MSTQSNIKRENVSIFTNTVNTDNSIGLMGVIEEIFKQITINEQYENNNKNYRITVFKSYSWNSFCRVQIG